VKTPQAPPLPPELDVLFRRMRWPYMRRAAPEICATARAQRWDPAEVLRVLFLEALLDDSGSASQKWVLPVPPNHLGHLGS
jgi:hypothetical protein